jgi:hypothetical protein
MSQYITDIAPYFAQEDQRYTMPAFQNTGAQQSYMNQQLAQANQMAQPTSRGSSFPSISPSALAAMLRKDPNAPQGASVMDKAAAYFGTQNTPEMQAEIKKLGSNTYNPMSDYNTGANGWGSYGE